MNEITEFEITRSGCDLSNVFSSKQQTGELESENKVDFDLISEPENTFEESYDKSNKEISQQEFIINDGHIIDSLDDNLENNEIQLKESVRKSKEEIESYQGDFEQISSTEDIYEIKEKGGRCCKLILISSSSIIWLSFLVYCYLYLSTVCVPVELWCPSPTHTFTAQACCSSLWLNLGSTVGLGNECTIDMADMEAGCPMYDCYQNDSVNKNIN